MLTRLPETTNIRRVFRVLTLILGLAACAGTAKAQAPLEWAVEAPITAIDPAARTILHPASLLRFLKHSRSKGRTGSPERLSTSYSTQPLRAVCGRSSPLLLVLRQRLELG